MKILGIDFGMKRVGIAVSDPEGRMAFPRPTLARSSTDAACADLAALCRQEGVQAVVIGLPLALDGSDTLTTRQARNFAKAVKKATGLPVHLVDERLTSVEAEERLREAGARGARVKERVDSQAAALILESFLASRAAAAARLAEEGAGNAGSAAPHEGDA